ncbi:MAG TPA: type II pantothenate kinase [Firmicutes bacterium]|nr:type II pantothenate kinase [Bacillota bacterium]HCF90499.1 type II pantothenate kinase [Bacillota bacterium]
MGNIIGIDIGGSTTKIIGYKDGVIFSPLLVKANDPIASVYGAFGKFLNANNLQLADVDRVMVTGVGSSYITSRLHNIPTGKVSEFQSIGRGGCLLSGLTNAIIVSMGTGTAYIKADGKGVRHLGGSGVGGGTLLGLSHTMLNVRNFDDLIETAQGGSLAHVDLTIGDISRDVLTGLPPDTTASNFGKLSDLASKADLAVGIFNLVFQTIGLLAIFAARVDQTKDIILTGNLVNVPQAPDIFAHLSMLFGVNFIIPPNAEFATAAGAAVSFLEGVEYQEF